MTLKICRKCDRPTTFPEGFVKSVTTLSGRGGFCKECDRARVQRRRLQPAVKEQIRVARHSYRDANLGTLRILDRERQRSKQVWLNSLKSNPCVDCARTFPACCMDFDHVRGTKIKGIGEMLSSSVSRIAREMGKCDLVCACCHRVRTEQQRGRTSNSARSAFYTKIAELKKHPCADCGGRFPPVAMDFDHVRGEKTATVSQMRTSSWTTVLIEVAKCDLVCACCHRTRTQSRITLKVA